MAVSKIALIRRGYPQAEIDMAQRQREAEARAGCRPRSLAEVLSGQTARARPAGAPVDLTVRQLRKRGLFGQAALLADQGALVEPDSERATKARVASNMLKELAQPKQTEFDFFMGNVVTGHQYHDAIGDRLLASGASLAGRMTARAVLAEIIRWLGWQTFTCEKTAGELAELLEMDRAAMTRTLILLETVGAIARVKRGRTKVIIVTPEGAYRGDINRHAEAVSRYRAEILPLRPRSTPADNPPDDPPAAS